MDHIYIWVICVFAFLLSCGLLLVLGHCSTKDTNTLQNDDVNIADPNYASRTVCWERTRGMRFGAETFLPRPPQPPVWAAVGNLLGMCMGDMTIRIAILTAVSTPQGVTFSIDSGSDDVRTCVEMFCLHGCKGPALFHIFLIQILVN